MLPSSGWSLRLRLLLSVGLVLLPPTLLGILQGVATARHDVADLRAQLVSTTRAAAAPTENILASAREIAIALSNVPDIRNANANCSADLASAMGGVPFLTNIARLDRTGHVICAALPKSVGRSISNRAVWLTIGGQTGFVVSGMTQSVVLRLPVVLGILPLHDRAGHFEGSLNIAISVRWLDDVLKKSPLPRGSVMAVFDRNTNLIAATNADVAGDVFARPMRHLFTDALVRTAKDKNGKAWSYATASLLGTSTFVGFAMPDTRLFGVAQSAVLIDILLPFVMIVLTWIAIWIVMDRQLMRWIFYLKRISAAYRSGHYKFRPALENAPTELRSLGDALSEMAAAIAERDRSLRDAVAQKTLLIREIHHRVKNNLQVVMSLLNLQSKRLKDPAAQAAIRETQARINALALVHRILYEIDDQQTVEMRNFLQQLAEQTREGFGGEPRDVQISVDALSLSLPSEMAVPLSLFAVEAITNAFKHAFPEDHGGTIRVVLERKGEDLLRLAIEDNGRGFEGHDESTSIGARLIKTFGQQVGGTSDIHSQAGNGTVVEMVFRDPAGKMAVPPGT